METKLIWYNYEETPPPVDYKAGTLSPDFIFDVELQESFKGKRICIPGSLYSTDKGAIHGHYVWQSRGLLSSLVGEYKILLWTFWPMPNQ